MDTKPFRFHPHRAYAFYQRPDMQTAWMRLSRLLEEDRSWAVMSIIEMAECNEDKIASLMRRSGIDWDVIDAASHIEFALNRFVLQGWQIFDFSILAPMLVNTSVDEIRIRDLPFPYDVFYLHFGECGLASPFGTPVEGCYVRRDPDDAVVLLTPVCACDDVAGLLRGPLEEATVSFG